MKHETKPPKKLADKSTNPEYSKDKLVLSWITSTSFPSTKTILIPCTLDHEASSLLGKWISPLSKIHIHTICDQIRTFKKDSKNPITEYLMHPKSLFISLTAASSTMTDEELIEYVLDGLGHEYKDFITSLHLRPSLSFDEFYDLLVQEEQVFNKMSLVSVSTGVYRASTDPQTHFNIERGSPTTPINTMDIEGKDEVMNADVDVVDDAQIETTTGAVAGSPITMVTDHVCPLVTIVCLFSRPQHKHTTNLMLFANNVTNPVTHLLCRSINQL